MYVHGSPFRLYFAPLSTCYSHSLTSYTLLQAVPLPLFGHHKITTLLLFHHHRLYDVDCSRVCPCSHPGPQCCRDRAQHDVVCDILQTRDAASQSASNAARTGGTRTSRLPLTQRHSTVEHPRPWEGHAQVLSTLCFQPIWRDWIGTREPCGIKRNTLALVLRSQS
jgi:hypothetical protein